MKTSIGEVDPMDSAKIRQITMSMPWNIFLLTVSGLLSAFSLNSIAVPHQFFSSGFYGTAMLITYAVPGLSLGFLYAALNIPSLILGWKFLSRRFIFYTAYCVTLTSLATQYVPWPNAGIEDPLLAAVAAGIGCGIATGLSLQTLGSDGGLTAISLVLYRKFNISVGTLSMAYNVVLFSCSLLIIDVNNILYSMVIVYFSATLMNYFMSAFDERKKVLIISDQQEAIAQKVFKELGRGGTVIHGCGAYTKRSREILMVVVHNVEQKRLEEIIFNIDPDAFVIIENPQLVLGRGFSQIKKY